MFPIWDFIITLLGGVLVLVFVVFYATKKPTSFLGRIFAFFLFGKKKQKLKLLENRKTKSTPSIDDYETDRYDNNLFYSLVDGRLRVRIIINKKRPDRITFSTSLPHRFISTQINGIKESILELSSCAWSDYEVHFDKSPAADFFGLINVILKKIFRQLHGVYAYIYFVQKVQIEMEGASEWEHVALTFLDIKTFPNELFEKISCNPILNPFSSQTDDGQPVFMFYKQDGISWSQINKEVSEILRQYFSVGVDFIGDWPEDDNKVEIKQGSDIWRVISEPHNLTIEALDGQEYISAATEVFKSHIDSSFKQLGFDHPGSATPEIAIEVSEMIADASYEELFTCIDSDLSKLALTQAQIISFCKKYPDWLRKKGLNTCFLMKKLTSEKYFVVYVYKSIDPDDEGDLGIAIDSLNKTALLHGEWHYRGVFPKLS